MLKSLSGWRQIEVQGLAENYRVEVEVQIADHGMYDLGLDQERGCIGPVQRRDIDLTTIIGNRVGFDSSECAWS